jgi:hypothetical protein
MCFLESDISRSLTLAEHLCHFPIPKITNNHGRTTLIFQKFLFHFSTWHRHHDTYVFGHMILGVDHTAWNYQSPTISSQSTNDTPREHTSPALVYFLTQQRRTFLLPITTGAPKTQFQPYPTPNITDNYDPITITACFNKNRWTSFCDAFFTLLPNGITTHNIRSQRRQAECSPSSSSVSIFRKFLFHFSTWYHHDTYVFGHLTLGVVHTAWNYQSPTI